jgi:hypothetical protein
VHQVFELTILAPFLYDLFNCQLDLYVNTNRFRHGLSTFTLRVRVIYA